MPNRKEGMIPADAVDLPSRSWLGTAGGDIARIGIMLVSHHAVFATRALLERNTRASLKICWPFNAELAQAAPKRFRIEAQLLGGSLSAINPPRRVFEDR